MIFDSSAERMSSRLRLLCPEQSLHLDPFVCSAPLQPFCLAEYYVNHLPRCLLGVFGLDPMDNSSVLPAVWTISPMRRADH
jgi:hypothetical protein